MSDGTGLLWRASPFMFGYNEAADGVEPFGIVAVLPTLEMTG